MMHRIGIKPITDTFTLKASDDNWKISAITREGDEEWIEDAKTSSAKKTGTTVVSELKRLLNEELAKAKALPHTKMLYGTPIDPKETQVLNTSVEDTKVIGIRPVGLHTKTVVAARGKVQHHMEILL